MWFAISEKKGSNMLSLLSIPICCNECGKNFISELMSAATPKVHISSTFNVRAKLGESVNLW